MMTGNFLHHSKRILFCLLIFGFSSILVLAQTSLSGDISIKNPSTHVVTIGVDRVTVDDTTGFRANDTILLIQMQGVKILTSSGYGTFGGKLGEPGMHEFLIIQSVTVSPAKEIVFRNNILQTYDPLGNVQIVRVPYYNNATVTSKLTCSAWDTLKKSGGVIALIIGRKLTLNADIDVSGLGFRGGYDAQGDGICRSTNTALYGLEYYPQSNSNAGYKGEGVANYSSDLNQPLGLNFMKGQGFNWTGGGGGNGRYSGGGGGSNRGSGGAGGYEENSCVPIIQWPGGEGGLTADDNSLPNRIYMGGGGGASTRPATESFSYGGNGGGVVIIVADSIVGNGHNILANGSNGGTITGLGGSGGGGAGGSIALSLSSYSSEPLNLSVSGGDGGDNPDNGYGEGGGGGGGLLYLSKGITTEPVTTNVNGGTSGKNPGSGGEIRPKFKAILNGFLFNSISSSITGTHVDSVCSNMVPPKIKGTIPVGGVRPYTYLWEKSYDQTTWTQVGTLVDSISYTPPATPEVATVYFRRTVTDSSPTPMVDVSKPVEIIVQPFIKNNIVGNSDTICYGQDPPAFTSQATLQDGNGIYSFNWGVSLNNSLFTVPVNSHNAEGYTPPAALKITSWYRRTVSSGRCIDSSAVVKITVLDTIANNNILNSPPDICFGSTFTNLQGSTASTSPDPLKGGDGSYIFKWESNINGSGWGTATGASDASGYDPAELPVQRIPFNQYIFRRVVYSGSNNVCVSVSDTVLLKDFPVITNNTISGVPAICSGSAPASIIGTTEPALSGGNTSYNFTWQDSSKIHDWAFITGATSPDYQSGTLTDTTWYRRIVTSTCTDISNKIRVVVHKPILNNIISVTGGGTSETLCNSQQPGNLIGSTDITGGTGGSYLLQWKYSLDNIVFTSVPSAGTGADYQPPPLTAPTYFIREVSSGACTVNSDTITETVLPTITNNTISGTAEVCYSLVPDPITGPTPEGGSGIYNYTWWQSTDGGVTFSAATGTNTSPTYQPPALFTSTKYERIVTSGLNDCCTSTSNIFDIAVDPLPGVPYAGPDTTIYSVDKIYHMKALMPESPDTGMWTILDNTNGSATFDDNTKNNTIVRNLSVGQNSFLWTLTRGKCTLSDSVYIELLNTFYPQGFSPNGDAWNNTFVIEGLNLEDNYVDLSIVNGAGSEVFKTSNRNGQIWTDWDGKNSTGLDLAEGTYYYLLKITSKTGNVYKKSGFIILKRY
jgi:hypothetical protein